MLESKFWKQCEPYELRCLAAIKFQEILHKERLLDIFLKNEKSRCVTESLPFNWYKLLRMYNVGTFKKKYLVSS